jgi:hypothetical protein
MVYFHGKVVFNNHETWGIQASTMMDEVLQWKISIESNVSLCVSSCFTIRSNRSMFLLAESPSPLDSQAQGQLLVHISHLAATIAAPVSKATWVW